MMMISSRAFVQVSYNSQASIIGTAKLIRLMYPAWMNCKSTRYTDELGTGVNLAFKLFLTLHSHAALELMHT